jgi:hypothetical protein
MIKRPLMLVSLNVRGLGRKSPKQKEIKTWISSLPTPPQVLLLQEHHLGEADFASSTKGLEFWNGSSF